MISAMLGFPVGLLLLLLLLYVVLEASKVELLLSLDSVSSFAARIVSIPVGFSKNAISFEK